MKGFVLRYLEVYFQPSPQSKLQNNEELISNLKNNTRNHRLNIITFKKLQVK
jgi:hypothetical protein